MIRLAVVGCGHLGRIHARLAAAAEAIELVALVDPVEAARNAVAADLGVAALATVDELPADLDAAILAAPTFLHEELGLALLERGLHLLIEKPLATRSAEANTLVAAARAGRRVLQVGHVERFNPALDAARDRLTDAKYIEARRYSGYTFRSTDIGVVLDMMIHDLDVVLSLVDSEVVDVEALGVAVMGEHEDAATARLKFANGCVANLSASRISYERMRRMQVWTPVRFAALDFDTGTTKLVEPDGSLTDGSFDSEALSADAKATARDTLFETLLPLREVSGPEVNAIVEEQADLVAAIETGSTPRVTGEAGRDAVALAERILAAIEQHQWDGHAGGPTGARRHVRTPIVPGPHWHLGTSATDVTAQSPRREAG
ncbi:MAG: gfo/Idh/MocA family oxidoreductase [Planctomycetota bacterium]|nr:MAG: gfo/Idh/MocA family oxidoreductase [Planctomycetota bacterium]